MCRSLQHGRDDESLADLINFDQTDVPVSNYRGSFVCRSSKAVARTGKASISPTVLTQLQLPDKASVVRWLGQVSSSSVQAASSSGEAGAPGSADALTLVAWLSCRSHSKGPEDQAPVR